VGPRDDALGQQARTTVVVDAEDLAGVGARRLAACCLARAASLAAASAAGAAFAGAAADGLSPAAPASLSHDDRATAGAGATPSRNTATAITPTWRGRSVRAA